MALFYPIYMRDDKGSHTGIVVKASRKMLGRREAAFLLLN